MGECKKSSNTVTARVPLLRLENRTLERQAAHQAVVQQGISSQQALPSFPLPGQKNGFSKADAAPKRTSHQGPVNALPLNNVLSLDELLPQPVPGGREAGGWSRAGRDNDLYILRSGEFYFLLSSPSNRYQSCQNIKSPDNKNTLQRRS